VKYEVIIYWSDADQAFIAEVPELPGCAPDGKSYRQALASVEAVIAEWIETAKELGRPIPSPKAASSSPDLVPSRLSSIATHQPPIKNRVRFANRKSPILFFATRPPRFSTQNP
jgi:predicted RNase H-like HicB family nuclease